METVTQTGVSEAQGLQGLTTPGLMQLTHHPLLRAEPKIRI